MCWSSRFGSFFFCLHTTTKMAFQTLFLKHEDELITIGMVACVLTVIGKIVRQFILASYYINRTASFSGGDVANVDDVAAKNTSSTAKTSFSKDDDKALEKRYNDPTKASSIPDPNEALALAKRMGKPVEQINNWFKRRRAADRTSVKASRFAESGWRLFLLSCSVGLYAGALLSSTSSSVSPDHDLGASFRRTNANLAVQIQVGISLHFLISHLLSGGGFATISPLDDTSRLEFWSVFGEQLLRVCVPLSLILFEEKGAWRLSGYVLASKISAARDACDALVEVSKILSLLSRHSLSLYTFMVLVMTWGWLRVYIQYAVLGKLTPPLGKLLTPPVVALGISLGVDVYGFLVLLRTSKAALWDGGRRSSASISASPSSRRFQNGSATNGNNNNNNYHSQSSLSATDLDSDSSLSSNLKRHED